MSTSSPPVLTKVCGFTRAVEAIHALNAGVHWIGLNFYPPSSRYISPQSARQLLDSLPDRGRAVGLFVNAPARQVLEVVGPLGLRIVQLHGDEPPADVHFLQEAGLVVIRAFRLSQPADVEKVHSWLSSSIAVGGLPDAVLLDTLVPGMAGGTGRLIPDDVLALILSPPPQASALPADLASRVILAGGLNPSNVRDFVRRHHPWMVDVASGVESAPGRKDPKLVESFLAAVQTACSLP